MFRLKGSADERLRVAESFKSALEALPEQIDVLQSIEVGSIDRRSTNNGRRACLRQTPGPRGGSGATRCQQGHAGMRGLRILK